VDEIASHFEIPGRLADAVPHGSGHIHDTYLLRFEGSQRPARYVLQRINREVFRDPEALMSNLARICAHQRREIEREGAVDPERRQLRLVASRSGETHWVDPEGGYWRCFHFIEGTCSLDAVGSEQQAYETARAFGVFAARMSRFEGPPLAVTIASFHDLERRYAALESAARRDSHARAELVRGELDHVAAWYDRLMDAMRRTGADALPVRIVHNDCKINNVLLDAQTGEGLCAIDLDTVMDGTIAGDFGELVRTSSCQAAEDEAGLEAMAIDLELLRGVARGYASAMGPLLTEREWSALPLAGSLLAFENAVRFLTDHLCGDVYFRIHREAHNLDRFRAQLRRVELLEAQRAPIERLVESARAEFSSDRAELRR
jgi:hypothetical protein